jgi:hypothetical protein
MAYLQIFSEGETWQRSEMIEIVNIFEDSLTLDLNSARKKIEIWKECHSPADGLVLRQIKTRLRLMFPGINYLSGPQAQRLSAWYQLLPDLP